MPTGASHAAALHPKPEKEEREGERELVLGDKLIWNQGVSAPSDHTAREVTHDGMCLAMEITKHLIGPPSTDKADDVGVDLGIQKCIGTCGAETSS